MTLYTRTSVVAAEHPPVSINRTLLLSAAIASAFFAPAAALAQNTAVPTEQIRSALVGQQQHFAISAQPLSAALELFSNQTGIAFAYTSSDLEGVQSPGVQGQLPPLRALAQLLAGTGINYQLTGSDTVALSKAELASDAVMPSVTVLGDSVISDDLPEVYAGGQIARGGRIGLLGNRDTMETPFSTTNYTAQMIEDRQANTVSDVLRSDASVRDIFPEGGAAEHFNVRGFSMKSHDFAWNGVFGLVPHNRVAAEFVERVEVLKGPGALLYGMALSGSVGGVVNLVPKRAADEPLTRLTATYSSDAAFGGHVDIGRRFGEDGVFGVRFNGVKSDGDTAVDNQSLDRGLGSIALDFRGERLRLSLDAYNIEERFTGGMPLLTSFASPDIPDAPDPTNNALDGGYSTSRSKAIIGAVAYDFSDQWTGNATLGTKRQTGAGYLNNGLGMNAQASGDYTGMAMNIKNYFDTNSGDVRLNGYFTTGYIDHEVSIGANIVQQETGAVATRGLWSSNIYSPGMPSLAADPDSTPKVSDTTLSSFAVADTLAFQDDSYLLTLGVRQQRVRTTNFDTSGATTSKYDESALTPAVGVVIKPWSAPVSLYANYIEGLSQGGTVSDTAATNYGEVFAPYKSKQLELGLKWDAGRFLNTVSVFQITKPSMIEDSATNTYSADGEQRNRGVEVSSVGEITKGVRLIGGATYIEAETTETADGLLDGKTVLGTPDWQANFSGEWDATWVPGLTLIATGIYTGEQYADDENTQQLPSWVRFDLGARYAFLAADHDIVLRGNVLNVANERYWSGVWNGYASVGAARTVQLSATIDF